MFVDSTVISKLTSDWILVKVNGGEDSVSKKAHHVSGYPTTILAQKSGEEIDRLVGYEPPEEFLQTMIDYSNGIGTLEDLLGKAKGSEDRALFYEIADKYKYRGGSEQAEIWYNKVLATGKALDSLSGESRIAVADMYRRAKEYDRAVEAFAAIVTDFETGSFVQEAEIYIPYTLKAKGDTTAAIVAFEHYVENYPESEDAEWANEQIEKLKNPTDTESK